MRITLLLTLGLLSACAGRELAVAPPPGSVDFSGRWILNEADSDDPMHLIQSQFKAAVAGSRDTSGDSGSRGGQRRRGGSGARQGGPGEGEPEGAGHAPLPSVKSMSAALRWPGKILNIKQINGVVTLASDEVNRVCQPTTLNMRLHEQSVGEHRRSADTELTPSCGWSGKSLVVEARGSGDQPPLVERYQISADGARLVELVRFGARAGGFSMSRVWDRAP